LYRFIDHLVTISPPSERHYSFDGHDFSVLSTDPAADPDFFSAKPHQSSLDIEFTRRNVERGACPRSEFLVPDDLQATEVGSKNNRLERSKK